MNNSVMSPTSSSLLKASSQYDANINYIILRYDVMLKCWNRLDFYSSVASVMSEQLT